ncbi:MAG: ABC transporter substrate-binding protein [Clostridia bacterium BRH_c25]|nr:MAG: ABC transporter substrate-binding protein [Clostridia bacterium BRH_c25]
MKRRLLALLLVACMAISLAACTPGGNSNTTSNTPSSSSETTVTAQGDMLSIIRMTEDWPTYFDPAVGSDFSDSITLVNIYDPLVFPQIDGVAAPHIAKEWQVSEDGLKYTFKIRDDVKFHSGNIMKASDVAFSMNRMLTIGEGYAYLYKGVVKEAEAVDDTTVVMTLERPFGPFISSLIRFMIVEEKLVMEHLDKSTATYGEFGDYGKQWLLTNDAGSGPYFAKEVKLEEYVLGEQFPDYFLGWEEDAPKYFKLSGAIEPVSVRTAMANKELEITDEIQPLENYNTMDTFEGVDVIAYESGTNMNLCLNTKKAPTDDIHFRKAMAYCFDYDTVLEQIYPGAKRSFGTVPGIIPGANRDIVPYQYNLEKAKEELALSKYANDPSKWNITMSWCAEVPEQEKIALLLQANLAELGVKIEVTKKPFGSMIADAQTVETTPNASLVNTSPSYFEAGAMLKTRYHSSSTGTWEQMEWVQNDELDAMIEDALATTDMDERFEKYKKIQVFINDLCPTLWLFDWVEKRACQVGYVDWNPYLFLKEGKSFVYPMGYSLYVHNMKVYPDKR